ncbi:MAG TPA: PP2C family protein-serine/threonine phosphatase, partial [Phycisphaerae bacterium]|nr:PP2C family protein-serine/threonine phosphatase [Phycisphaerae bacterium]
IADVSGHGTPAAVLMAITHAIAHAQPGTHTPPANLLASLNHQLARSYMRGGAFATAFYAVLDPAARTLTYSLAGHNPPRLVRAGRVLSLGENGALPLGIREHETYAEAMVKLEKGDLLLLYTDGVTETMAPGPAHAEVDLFGLERLDKLLLNCGDAGAEECIRRIQSEVAAFGGGAPPTDDQTVIAIRC